MVIYPNPLSGARFNVLLPAGFETANSSVTIEDMMGREIATQRIDVQQHQISVSLTGELAKGIYTVVLKNDTQRFCDKLTVVK
jgi:hypothetical protein